MKGNINNKRYTLHKTFNLPSQRHFSLSRLHNTQYSDTITHTVTQKPPTLGMLSSQTSNRQIAYLNNFQNM